MAQYHFENRELSWLKFNDRVLEEAVNFDNPLLERGKFISIAESNLDEFYMVRVGGLMHKMMLGSRKKDIAGMTPLEQLSRINTRAHRQADKLYDILMDGYLPELQKAGVSFLRFKQANEEQKAWLSHCFDSQIAPLLTPRAIDLKRPFPLLAARNLHLALLLPPVARGSALRFAIITLPQSLPRVMMLPMGEGRARGMLLEDVVAAFAFRLFNGARPLVCQPFRLTRNTDFGYNDNDADALIIEMRKNLKKRKWGQVVRFEIPSGFDSRLLSRLKRYLEVPDHVIFFVKGPLNPNYFMKQIALLEGLEELRFKPYAPRIEQRVKDSSTMFDAMKKGDILFHHPYDSFEPVLRLMNEAADDPNVLAIKQTLYRVSGKSPIVAALSRAAQNGKQVTVLIEVRARFDEENNINWCRELEKAGCHVIYGVPKLKAHSKITLIVRKEGDALKRYVHLSTGNYNDSTAKLYTDFGFMTADSVFGLDAGAFFNTVTGYSDTAEQTKLIAAPDGIRKALTEMIKAEKERAENGLPSGITLKCNSLTDKKIIKHLYRAADAGVPVELIVRGACLIKLKGHKNISVRSIVGRFLEHVRVYIFHNAGDPAVFLSSADLMTRNLDKRVELMFPLEDKALKQRAIDSVQLELRDNMKAWTLKKSGVYQRAERKGPPLNAQEQNILLTLDNKSSESI